MTKTIKKRAQNNKNTK